MPTGNNTISSYGVQHQRVANTDLEKAAEELSCLGYSVIESGYSADEIDDISRVFDAVHAKYVDTFGIDFLRELNEHNGMRLPLAFNAKFIDLAMNSKVLELVQKVIRNQFILNQQNGVINPPSENYNQGAWHRDLPYQHFVSSKPLAVNALYCVDDFTSDNGATFVLPASHVQEEFPSDSYVEKMAHQITAPAGAFIVMHGMLFHRGGANRTSSRRRAVNHLYTTAFIKQQIDIPSTLGQQPAPAKAVAELLGFRYQIPRSVADYLKSRPR